MATQLNKVIAGFNQRYEDHMKKLEKMLDLSSSDQRLFSSNTNKTLLISIKKLFEQFKGDSNVLRFTSAIHLMDKKKWSKPWGKTS